MPLSYATRQVADPPVPQMKQQMSKQQKHLSRISPQWYAGWTYFGMMMLWSCHKSQTHQRHRHVKFACCHLQFPFTYPATGCRWGWVWYWWKHGLSVNTTSVMSCVTDNLSVNCILKVQHFHMIEMVSLNHLECLFQTIVDLESGLGLLPDICKLCFNGYVPVTVHCCLKLSKCSGIILHCFRAASTFLRSYFFVGDEGVDSLKVHSISQIHHFLFCYNNMYLYRAASWLVLNNNDK